MVGFDVLLVTFSIWSLLFTYFGGWDENNENMNKSTVFERISIYLHDLHLNFVDSCIFIGNQFLWVVGKQDTSHVGFLWCNHYHISYVHILFMV
jgi:hypothetical protein